MAYDFTQYSAKNVVIEEVPLNGSNGSSRKQVVCSINPESVKESVSLNLDKVQLVNNNLPRTIASGTKGRTVSFTLLLHGMSTPKSAALKYSAGNFNTFASAAISLIPFSSNIIRGIQTVQDVIGHSNSSPEYAARQQQTDYLNVDKQISDLFSMQVPKNGRSVHNSVKLVGYQSFNGLNFYIENIQVTRKLWDPKLRTMFAEVEITLFQVGKNENFGSF